MGAFESHFGRMAQLTPRHRWVCIAALSVVVTLVLPASAVAFDAGPHSEITSDALTAENFGRDAIGVTEVNNWFCDFYEQASKNPFSGHAGFVKRLLAGAITSEDWPQAVIDAAWRCHFDNSAALSNTAGETTEWDRLRRAVWTLAQEARHHDDPEELLAVLGISLHEVQDFYAHTNWVEPQSANGLPGADGPGWKERGFGSSPTWFDIPASARNAVTIYSDESPGHRPHGYWNSDGNTSVRTAMNKDWPGRPYYLQAATTAYFATRQWVEAVRSWVGDDAFWREAQSYRADRSQLSHDLEGMFNIQLWTGHWQGQGEPLGGDRPGPGGSLLDLRSAIKDYMQYHLSAKFIQADPFGLGPLRGRTVYRARFEQLVTRVEEPHPSGLLQPVPSSQDLQRSIRFVVLRVLKMRGEGLGDPGPDEADMYVRARIDGQPMSSAVIHGDDSYSFPPPNAPFTWIKAVPAVSVEQQPVESIELEVKTTDVRWAGTDDDVFLRLGHGLRFPLDKRLYNDFERGDHDTYSVPIDSAVEAGLRVGDITRVGIEKASDGLAGGWKLGGVKLRVNGVVIYDDTHINRWLEDNHRSWSAPDFTPSAPLGQEIPVWLNLRESDSLYGSDDEGDVNPFDRRDTVAVGYAPGRPFWSETRGENRLGGRLGYGGDGATIDYSLETIAPEPMSVVEPPPSPPVEPKPDLVITDFTVTGVLTVKNQGNAAAGDFRVNVSIANDGTDLENFSGLRPGESETRQLPGVPCEGGPNFAVVDDLEQVDESDETNNTARPRGTVIC